MPNDTKRSVKGFFAFILVPLTRRYLKSDRTAYAGGLRLEVPAGVFHPTLFPSSRMLWTYLAKASLRDRSLLEIGCGSGVLSIKSALQGARVTAIDISPLAVNATRRNAGAHRVDMTILQSDIYENLPAQPFDWVVVNPPYYRGAPRNVEEYAWRCGEQMEYFEHLFGGLGRFTHAQSEVIMSLTGNSEVEVIQSIAGKSGFQLELLVNRYSWLDGRDYLFRVHPTRV